MQVFEKKSVLVLTIVNSVNLPHSHDFFSGDWQIYICTKLIGYSQSIDTTINCAEETDVYHMMNCDR